MTQDAVLLRTEGISRRFGGLTALDDVSVEIPRGALVGILGPNGAGKTTFFNVLTGVYPATKGRVWFDGREVTNLPPYRLSRLGIGRTWQAGRPFESLSLFENVLLGYDFGAHGRRGDREEGRAVAEEAIELVGMAERRDRPAADLNVFERKMLELARCIAARSRLLLLDEILAGLNPHDLAFAVDLITTIRQRYGMTIIWIEHIVRTLLNAVEMVIVLHHGQILARGTPREIVRDPKVIDAYLGEALDVIT